MARRAVSERRKRIVDQLAKMLVNYLQEVVFKGRPTEEIIKRTGLSSSVLSVPWFTDVPEICEGAGVDIGLTIRDSKGNEVTLWPLENFSEGFKPRKAAGKKVQRPDPSHYTSPRPHLPAQQQQSTVRYITGQGRRGFSR